VDGNGRPLAVLIGPGQGSDTPMCLPVVEAIRAPRLGPGRPRTRPDALLVDQAYSSRAIRTELRRRGIVSVIPEPRDQQGHRKRRGSRGGRRVTYNSDRYKGRNVVERAFCLLKQWRGLATPLTTSTPPPTAAPSSSPPSTPGYGLEDTPRG